MSTRISRGIKRRPIYHHGSLCARPTDQFFPATNAETMIRRYCVGVGRQTTGTGRWDERQRLRQAHPPVHGSTSPHGITTTVSLCEDSFPTKLSNGDTKIAQEASVVCPKAATCRTWMFHCRMRHNSGHGFGGSDGACVRGRRVLAMSAAPNSYRKSYAGRSELNFPT